MTNVDQPTSTATATLAAVHKLAEMCEQLTTGVLDHLTAAEAGALAEVFRAAGLPGVADRVVTASAPAIADPRKAPDIGGYFSGGWEYRFSERCYETAYAAVRFGEPWHDDARPVVTRRVMDALIARAAIHVAAGEEGLELAWDSSRDRVLAPGPGNVLVEALRPDSDGNFDLGELGWSFRRLGDDHQATRWVR